MRVTNFYTQLAKMFFAFPTNVSTSRLSEGPKKCMRLWWRFVYSCDISTWYACTHLFKYYFYCPWPNQPKVSSKAQAPKPTHLTRESCQAQHPSLPNRRESLAKHSVQALITGERFGLAFGFGSVCRLLRIAVPLWGRTTQNLSDLSSTRDCSFAPKGSSANRSIVTVILL